MIRLICFLAGGIGGWLLKTFVDKKTEEAKPADPVPPCDVQCKTVGEMDEVIEEQLAMTETPPEDLPDEIEVPALPFEELPDDEEEEEEEDHPNGFHPAMDAPRIEIISEDQYLDGYFAYGKETLYYYSEIDELTFSDEDRVEDKAAAVDKRIDLLFDKYGRDGVLYVRNNRMSIDFMIVEKKGTPYWYDESE